LNPKPFVLEIPESKISPKMLPKRWLFFKNDPKITIYRYFIKIISRLLKIKNLGFQRLTIAKKVPKTAELK